VRRAAPGSSHLLAKVRCHSARTADCPCGIVDKQGDYSRATLSSLKVSWNLRRPFRALTVIPLQNKNGTNRRVLFM
jgi:hypothetical protein